MYVHSKMLRGLSLENQLWCSSAALQVTVVDLTSVYKSHTGTGWLYFLLQSSVMGL